MANYKPTMTEGNGTRIFRASVPVAEVKAAQKAVQGFNGRWKARREQLKQIEADYRGVKHASESQHHQAGLRGDAAAQGKLESTLSALEKEHRSKVAAIEQEGEEDASKTLGKVEQLQAAALAAVDSQSLPNADDTESNGYKVMKEGLADSPSSLGKVIGENPSATLAVAAKAYAANRGWSGFDYADNADSVRDYLGKVFDNFIQGVNNPMSYSMFAAVEEEEPRRLAKAFGVLENYAQGERDSQA